MEYLTHLAILTSIYAILGVSLNLVVGYTGLLSVTHAAFYGIGAYAVGVLTVHFGWNFFAALAAGMVFSGSAGWGMGKVLSKFKGDYYALVSFGFNSIVFSILLNWQSVTRGPLGIPGIAKPAFKIFNFEFLILNNGSFLILSFIFAALAYGISTFIARSSFGRVLKAIREDESAIQVFGYDTPKYKLIIFVIGAIGAAVAGALFASYISFIDPSTFTLNESVFILSIIIVGGLANLRGSMLGALIMILLPEFLRFVGFPPDIAAQMRQVVYGLILILLMLYRPQGLIGEYKL